MIRMLCSSATCRKSVSKKNILARWLQKSGCSGWFNTEYHKECFKEGIWQCQWVHTQLYVTGHTSNKSVNAGNSESSLASFPSVLDVGLTKYAVFLKCLLYEKRAAKWYFSCALQIPFLAHGFLGLQRWSTEIAIMYWISLCYSPFVTNSCLNWINASLCAELHSLSAKYSYTTY